MVSDGGRHRQQAQFGRNPPLWQATLTQLSTPSVYFNEQDADRNPGVLKRLAKDTGGEAFLPESLKERLPICERIARDIRNQYTLAYIPSNRKPDGTYRHIQVRANTPGHEHLVIRTRAGYLAPSVLPSPSPKATDHDAQN